MTSTRGLAPRQPPVHAGIVPCPCGTASCAECTPYSYLVASRYRLGRSLATCLGSTKISGVRQPFVPLPDLSLPRRRAPDTLRHAVKFAQRQGVRKRNAPPDHRADSQQPGFQLQSRSCFRRFPGIRHATKLQEALHNASSLTPEILVPSISMA